MRERLSDLKSDDDSAAVNFEMKKGRSLDLDLSLRIITTHCLISETQILVVGPRKEHKVWLFHFSMFIT